MVSVVVPVYNTEKYLRRCLDALVNQTLPKNEFEIIAVNDGSTDGSPAILKEYSEKYPDFFKVFNKENGGQTTARNLGIQKASGDYIGFADSDDYVDTTMYEKLLSIAKRDDADIVECHYHSMLELDSSDENGMPLYKEIQTRGTITARSDPRELFLDPQVSPWNKLYRRSVLVNGDVRFPEGMIYEDTSFYIKSIPFIKKQSYLDEKLVYYSVRQKSTMTSNLGKKVGDIFSVLNDILDFYRQYGLYEKYKAELEYFCVKIAFCSNLSRIGRVGDPAIKRDLLNKTFEFVNKEFPDYRKNRYFQGKIGLYIRSVNKMNCRIYAKALSKVMVG